MERCVHRIAGTKDREAFREMLSALVENNAIPIELLETIPDRADTTGRTRMDQIYEACMFLALPRYRDSLREKVFGPEAKEDMRLWRVMLPKEFGLSHVVVRAESFSEAFALGCDYACRSYLQMRRKVPEDLTIRVQYMSDARVSKMHQVRRAVRALGRKKGTLPGRKYTYKEIAGARLVAIGRKDSGSYSIFKYSEKKDLQRILEERDVMRVSSVETETFRKKRPLPP